MTDFLVKHLPRYVNQFAPSPFVHDPSGYRCVTATGAEAIDFAFPEKYNPVQIEHDEYVRYAGPDVPSDHNGLSKEQLLEILHRYHVGVIDMDALVQEGLHGDTEALLEEIEAQNRQDVVQVITVEDESHLKHAKTGVSLHNWSDALNHGAHTFLRVGFSDDEGYGLYMEPAAPGFAQPVPIAWSDIVSGKVITCVAIMPPGVEPPPAHFSYQHATWPTPPPPPKPPIDVDKAEQAILALLAACKNQEEALQKQLDTSKEMQTVLTALQGVIKVEDEEEAAEHEHA